jgi:hypothetical protein
MDLGQIISAYSRLILGALAAFFAIVLWSKTRDTAWMLVIISTFIVYIEVICSILEMLGIIAGNFPRIGSVPLPAALLPALRMVFLIAAFLVILIRRYRSTKMEEK